MESITSKDKNLLIGEKTLSQAEQKQTIIQKLKESSFIKSPEHVRKSIQLIIDNKIVSAAPFSIGGIMAAGFVAEVILMSVGLMGVAGAAVMSVFGVFALIAIAIGIYMVVNAKQGSIEDGEAILNRIYTGEFQKQPNWQSMRYDDFIKEKHPEATMMGWDKIDIAKFAEEFTLSQLKALENEVDRLGKIQK